MHFQYTPFRRGQPKDMVEAWQEGFRFADHLTRQMLAMSSMASLAAIPTWEPLMTSWLALYGIKMT